MAQSATGTKRKIVKAERQQAALELRQSGLSVRAIATRIGVSHTQALKDVQGALDDLAASQRLTTEQYRTLQTERLHSLLLACYPQAITGDLDAIKVAASLADQLSKLHGLYSVPPSVADGTAALLTTPMFGRLIAVFMGVLDGQPEDLRIRAADAIAAMEEGE